MCFQRRHPRTERDCMFDRKESFKPTASHTIEYQAGQSGTARRWTCSTPALKEGCVFDIFSPGPSRYAPKLEAASGRGRARACYALANMDPPTEAHKLPLTNCPSSRGIAIELQLTQAFVAGVMHRGRR